MKKTSKFVIQELVCQHIYNRDGDKAFRYFRPVVLDFLDWFRIEIGKPVYINNWHWKGDKSQRGLRCNLCQLVKNANKLYMSAHITGSGIDLNVKDTTPNDVRKWIENNIDRFFDKFPQYIKKIRLESAAFAPTWVHIDFYEHDEKGIVQYVKP